MSRVSTLVIAGLIFLTSSQAGARDGNDLVSDCTASRTSSTYYQDDASCTAYIQGFIEGATSFQEFWPAEKKAICIPVGVTAGQMRDVVVKFLIERPELRHQSSMQLITSAAVKAFPC